MRSGVDGAAQRGDDVGDRGSAPGSAGAAGWMYDCSSTVIRPPDAAAYRCICGEDPVARRADAATRVVLGGERVPGAEATSLRTVASMRRGSMSRSSARSSASGCWLVVGRPGPVGRPESAAAAGWPSRVTPAVATAAAAEMERKVRRLA